MKSFKEFVKEADTPPIPTTSPIDGGDDGMISTPNPAGDEYAHWIFGQLFWPRLKVILGDDHPLFDTEYSKHRYV